jgi:hypothetical protein
MASADLVGGGQPTNILPGTDICRRCQFNLPARRCQFNPHLPLLPSTSSQISAEQKMVSGWA